MATRYPKSAQTGDEGIAYISFVCAKSGFIFRPFETADIGVDGLIEFVDEKREPTGDIVLVQGKAGKSYVARNRYLVKADQDHFETWARYSIPVVGIVHNPAANDARWVDITDILRENPDIIANGPYDVECPTRQIFGIGQVDGFREKYRKGRRLGPSASTPPNLSIREWKGMDTKPTRALLASISSDYPDFYGWLAKQWAKQDVSKKVVDINGTIAAYSMWSMKDNRNIKLQTFIVGIDYQGTAVGQHLLFHELRTWAAMDNVQRVYVTISSAKADLISYFYRFGFRVEGIAANRYERTDNTAELVLAKHLVKREVLDTSNLRRLSNFLSKSIWGISGRETVAPFDVPADSYSLPLDVPTISVRLDDSDSTIEHRIALIRNDGSVVRSFDDYTLMREFYPLKLYFTNKRYVVVPIYRRYADALFATAGSPEEPTSLKLRLDNVYYCTPRIKKLCKGDFVVFYETKQNGGRGAALGAAIICEVRIDTPSKLWASYGNKGVFQLTDIKQHTRDGNAMAIHFDLFEPFKNPVKLEIIREILKRPAVFQSLSGLQRDEFRSIVNQGQE